MKSSRVSLTSPDGTPVSCYVSYPHGTVRGGLVCISEIWGLVPQIERTADRFAKEGYVVIAPDILSHQGVTPDIGKELFNVLNHGDEEARKTAQPKLREAMAGSKVPAFAKWAVGTLKKAVDWLERAPGVDGRIGVTGFCFGGTYTFELVAADPRIIAAVPWYGTACSAEKMRSISIPILAIYGAHDPAIMDRLPLVREQMAEAGVSFEPIIYQHASHAFFNEDGARYRKDDAEDAWRKCNRYIADRFAAAKQ